MSQSKQLPNAEDFEKLVLGSLLLDNCFDKVMHILRAESFYNRSNSIIYRVMSDMFNKSLPISIPTVYQNIKKENLLDSIGGAVYLSELTDRVASSSSIEYHARIVQQKYMQRELIRISRETMAGAYDDLDVFKVIAHLEKNLTDLSKNYVTGKGIKSIASLWNDVMTQNDMILNKKGLTGVPTGFPDMDSLTGGWQEPSLIIIAARPAMGKTALALNLARHATVAKFPVLVFSLEMSALQISQRIFSMESGVSNADFTRRGIESQRLVKIQEDCSKLINSDLYIDDQAAITLNELVSKARKMHREKGIKMIVIDYMQLMSGDSNKGNREQEISTISRGLKVLAKELQIPIIALSQLSREVEKRADRKPQLSDLRESGAIEQDADIVVFIHRAEYYNILQDENGNSTVGKAEIIFSKNRSGPTGSVSLNWIANLTKFEPEEPLSFAPAAGLNPNRNFETEKEDAPF